MKKLLSIVSDGVLDLKLLHLSHKILTFYKNIFGRLKRFHISYCLEQLMPLRKLEINLLRPFLFF